ncbi:long-chain fatty acid transport protein [Salmonella sp. NCTC 11881]|nr:long-chain fatty acid transport protein [Salmonella sp. NCTC 11881]
MSQKTLFTKSALAVAVAIISTQAWSAGFQLNEFSSSGLGRAYSGEGAIADDAGNVSRNPALITMFDRPTFSAGAVYIDPDVNISGTSPSRRTLDADNIAPTAWVPNVHFVAPINDQFGWGASITSNYGLATEFNDTYAGGSVGGTTDLETMNLNLSGAYRLNEAWSFGLGFDAVYARAKIERFAGDLGQLVAAQNPALAPVAGQIPSDTKIAHLNGNQWGFGWNAGILYELDKNNRYALTYRSEVKIDFKGNYSSDLPIAINRFNLPIPTATGGATQSGYLTLNLPEMWEVSGYNRVAPQWAIHYSLAYTSWSQFQELKAKSTAGDTLFEKHEGFKDAYRIALGTTYYYDDNWTFRTGIAFDDSPVPAQKPFYLYSGPGPFLAERRYDLRL